MTTDRPRPGSPEEVPTTGRRPAPARIRIMAWVVLLMAAVLALVNVVIWRALDAAATDRVDRAVSQEISEFQEFAAVGVDPRTGERFTDLDSLFRVHLSRQYPDRYEVIFGHVDEVPGAATPTGRIRQGQEPLFDVSADPEALEDILDAPGARGRLDTPEGALWWEKLRVSPPEGSSAPAGWFVIGYFTDADRAETNRTLRTLALVSLGGLLLAGTAAWWVAGRILAPIRLVRQTAAQITEEDLTRRIDVPGNDDVSALAEQFNAMLDRLEEAFSTQRRFVDDASHELRTPITIVRGHLELMGDDPHERAEVLRLVTDELDRMARIVEELLLLAKAQRPDFLHCSEVSLAELTSDIDAKVRALGDRDWRLDEVGFGLFGVLSIIRLRSDQITQGEIGYYFAAIVLGLINAVAASTPVVLVALNAVLLGVLFTADHPRLLPRTSRRVVTLDVVHRNPDTLRADLEARLGGTVHHALVTDVDYVRDLMVVDVRFREGAARRIPVRAGER